MKLTIGNTLSVIFLLTATLAHATAYKAPLSNESLIGETHYDSFNSKEEIALIAKRYDIGHNALQSANPHVDLSNKTIPYDETLQIPTKHLLPNQPREGIVVNLPEMRMYYYLDGRNVVLTYPIGIGKIGKTIPITEAAITRKVKNPIWIPPEDIREFNLKQGIVTPKIMPPGPDNPLGPYAIYLSVPTFLIHSTIFPESIGKRASFGCIRMYESDIKKFFPTIEGGIPVVIINSPVKVGWQQNHLYMESHTPLEEHGDEYEATLPGVVHLIHDASKNQPTLIDWQLVSYLDKYRDGIPHEIGMKIR